MSRILRDVPTERIVGRGREGGPRVGVVLAAGGSSRMHDVTEGGSKALIRVGGLTLIERAVRMLLSCGLERVVVVVGHHARRVRAVVDHVAPGRVDAVYADSWQEGNGASLAAARSSVEGESVFAVITMDHVFEANALDEFLRNGRPAVLVDHAPPLQAWAEGTRVRVLNDHAVAFSKELEEEVIDCGAFVVPHEIFDAQRRAAAQGDTSLAAAVTELAKMVPLAAVPLPRGTRWQDVDEPTDVRRARRMLRASLSKAHDGPVARWLNRPVSTRISMLLAPLRLHPDLVSLAAFVVGVSAAGLLGAGHGVAGGLLVQACSILDGSDGEAARLQLRPDPRGAFLDGVLDRLCDAAILAGLGIWALGDGTTSGIALILTVGAVTGSLLSMATKDRASALGLRRRPERATRYLLAGRDGRLFVIAIASVLGRPALGLGMVAFTSAIALVIRVGSVYASSLNRPRGGELETRRTPG
jgi:1L-myo-inositol 1-phosphate cytidylyltransferase / CDP-L-myo-inositol myo-inositolphosphotransferase